ncbi:MAG: hypothetical protein R3B54_00135 [Bdellovibrionota bacterium]
MNGKLLNGDLDFAFVDDFSMDPRVRTERVYDETLELCASPELVNSLGPVSHTKNITRNFPTSLIWKTRRFCTSGLPTICREENGSRCARVPGKLSGSF